MYDAKYMDLTVSSTEFPLVYNQLLRDTFFGGVIETNTRTGKQIKVHRPGSFNFRIDLSSGLLPVVGTRKLFPATAAAETAWYLSGTQDASFILEHARPVWEKFLEPLIEKPTVKAAYGYRWRRHFSRDQITLAIKALKANPSDRRIYISAWDPAIDGLGAPNQLNVPCPVGFTLSILDGHLNSTYTLRSSDIFVGLPYDVMGHAILMSLIANELGVELGCMNFALAHPHLYDVHYEMAEACLISPITDTEFELPTRWTTKDVEAQPLEFVQKIRSAAKEVQWPKYCPKPEVVQ